MSLFRPRKNLKTPRFPIIKIIISIIIISLSINRKLFYSLLKIELEGILKILEMVIFLVVGIIGIWTIYMALVEIYYIYENRVDIKEKKAVHSLKTKKYSLDEVILMLKNNDIIEIKIKVGDEILKIGSSSNCKEGSNKFFDKKFYIENNEFDDLDTFLQQLKIYSKYESINVISID